MTGRWLSDAEQRVWRDLLRLQRDLPALLTRQLQEESGLSGSDYAVLVALSETAGQRLRPAQIGAQIFWEQSRVSHHLTRMERRGLICRESCATDARGAWIVLTDAGRTAIEAAAPGHAAAVRDLVFDRLTEEETRVLGAAFGKILHAIADSGASQASEASQA